MSSNFIIIVVFTSSALVNAQLGLMPSSGRPSLLFKGLQDGFSLQPISNKHIDIRPTLSPMNFMESDIAAVFQAAAYGRSLTTVATEASSTTVPTTTKQTTMSTTLFINIDSETVTPLVDVTNAKEVGSNDILSQYDIEDERQLLNVEESNSINYSHGNSFTVSNTDYYPKSFSYANYVTETSSTDTIGLGNKQTDMKHNSLIRIYVGLALLSIGICACIGYLLWHIYSKNKNQDMESKFTIKNNLYESFTLNPGMVGSLDSTLKKSYISLDFSDSLVKGGSRNYRNYCNETNEHNNSSMLVNDSGFVRFRTEIDPEQHVDEVLRKSSYDLYHSSSIPADLCYSNPLLSTHYYCIPLPEGGLEQSNVNNKVVIASQQENYSTNLHGRNSYNNYDVLRTSNQETELPTVHSTQRIMVREHSKISLMNKIVGNSKLKGSNGYSQLDILDSNSSADEDLNIV